MPLGPNSISSKALSHPPSLWILTPRERPAGLRLPLRFLENLSLRLARHLPEGPRQEEFRVLCLLPKPHPAPAWPRAPSPSIAPFSSGSHRLPVVSHTVKELPYLSFLLWLFWAPGLSSSPSMIRYAPSGFRCSRSFTGCGGLRDWGYF